MKENELLFKFGQRLKNLREQREWSLRILEAKTNIDNSELSKYESGYVNPQLFTLYKLSKAFEMSLSEFLDIEKDF